MATLGWDSGGFQYSSCHLLHPIQTYFLSCSSCLQELLLLPHLHSLDTTTSWHRLQYSQLFSGTPQPFFLDNLHVFLPPMDLTSTSNPYQGPKLTMLFQDPKRAATATKEHPPQKAKLDINTKNTLNIFLDTRFRHKSTVRNIRDSMSLPEACHPIAVSPGKCNIAEAQHKDFEITIKVY